ncbi:hypothetical protein NLU13_3995 [Sarocladium strictum]|uniref:Cytochrome P450 n=1 Tax=Sarocladium strictum TaxID=5046 RepID=A0AA39GI27_SARSR|nr:hypothetical protein NLU13_3995 [Sarocladium strictum]
MGFTASSLWLLCCIIGISFVNRKREIIVHLILSRLIYPVKDSQGLHIPGPRWKWTDGQCLDKFLRGHQLSRAGRRYGNIYRIWSGLTPEIVISQPDHVKQFHRDSSLHEKSTSSNGGWLFHQQLGDCLGLINGEPWKKLRAIFHPHLTHRSVARALPQLVSSATNHLSQLTALQGPGGNVYIDACNSASFPFFATAEFIYGPLSIKEKEQLWDLGQRSLQLMGKVLSGGVYRFKMYEWLQPSTHRVCKEFERDWTAFNKGLYVSRKAMSDSAIHLDRPPFLNIWESFNESGLPQRMLIHTISEVLFANLDVSTHVLTWLVIYISQDQDVQHQLRQEINSASNIEEYITNKSTLLHLCFVESARLRPFTAFSIPESSPRPLNFGGFDIPANSSVVVDTVAINHNPEFWGPDSHEFKPLRLRNMSPSDLRYNLFAFGFGTRKCLGQYLGEAMTKVYLVTVLQKYALELFQSDKEKGFEEASNGHTWVPLSDVRVSLVHK